MARERPIAKVSATEAMAKVKVQRMTPSSGPRRLGSVKARAKFSMPTSIFQPVVRVSPLLAAKAPLPLSW